MPACVRAIACASVLLLTGCIHFVEPDDPPGTYVDAQATRELVIADDGAYTLREGTRSSRGHWSLLPGCAFGGSRLGFEPNDGSEPFVLHARERWFGGVVLRGREGELRPR